MHKVVSRHLAAIRSGTVTRSTMIGIRKLVSAAVRREGGLSVSRTQPAAPWTDVCAVLDAIETGPGPYANEDLLKSGLAVLRNPRNRRNLARVADIVPDVVSIRLVDYSLQEHTRGYFVPIWRAETADGRWFSFRNIPWQSGGNGPEVFNVRKERT